MNIDYDILEDLAFEEDVDIEELELCVEEQIEELECEEEELEDE